MRINVPTSAHSLRHGFATYLAEQGADPAALQILLGHESLDATTRYVHASNSTLKRLIANIIHWPRQVKMLHWEHYVNQLKGKLPAKT